MLDPLMIIITILLLIVVLSLFLIWYWSKKLGILKGSVIYTDSERSPGYLLKSNRIPLMGKPDYLIKDRGLVYPVEFKRSKSPSKPYQNHVMQLMAYCFLVEEHFGKRPDFGFIKYLDKEFKVQYTIEQEIILKQIVNEILESKAKSEELHCNHSTHYK